MQQFLFGSIGANLVLGFLLLSAREDIGEERERCNTEKQADVAAARLEVTRATQASYEERIAELEQMRREEEIARLRLSQAVRAAQERPEVVRTIIREVERENTCLAEPVPAVLIDGLRN